MMRGRGPDRAARFDAANSGLKQIGEIVPVVGQLAVGPEHAAGNFVAHLHHVGCEALFGKCGDGVAGVRKDLLDELLVIEFGPCRRHGLLGGIGPTVGVVQIEENVEAHGLGAAGERQRVREIVGQLVRCGRGIVEEAQADPVVVVLAQNSEDIFGLAVFLEDHTVLLALGEEGDVGANGILLRKRGPRGENCQGKNADQHWKRAQDDGVCAEACQLQARTLAEVITFSGHGSDLRFHRYSRPVVITSWYSGTRRMLSSFSI